MADPQWEWGFYAILMLLVRGVHQRNTFESGSTHRGNTKQRTAKDYLQLFVSGDEG